MINLMNVNDFDFDSLFDWERESLYYVITSAGYEYYAVDDGTNGDFEDAIDSAISRRHGRNAHATSITKYEED